MSLHASFMKRVAVTSNSSHRKETRFSRNYRTNTSRNLKSGVNAIIEQMVKKSTFYKGTSLSNKRSTILIDKGILKVR